MAASGGGRSRPLARFVEVLREEGVSALWFRSLGEICYRRLLMLERSLAEPAAEIASDLLIEVSVLENPAEYREAIARHHGA